MYGVNDLTHLDGHPVQPHLLSAMGEVTSHRRPDDEGMHIDALMRLVRLPGDAVLPAKVQGLCS